MEIKRRIEALTESENTHKKRLLEIRKDGKMSDENRRLRLLALAELNVLYGLSDEATAFLMNNFS